MNGDSVDVGVVDEPNDLIGEQFSVVLTGEIGFRRFGRVQLQTFADPLAQHVQSGIGLHNLGHGLLDQRLATREPVAESAEKGNGRDEGHVIRRGTARPRKSAFLEAGLDAFPPNFV